jgi:hypothetical protein
MVSLKRYLHLKYEDELSAKSLWVQHMPLQSDMKTESQGMLVRVIEGLTGVDYFTVPYVQSSS